MYKLNWRPAITPPLFQTPTEKNPSNKVQGEQMNEGGVPEKEERKPITLTRQIRITS